MIADRTVEYLVAFGSGALGTDEWSETITGGAVFSCVPPRTCPPRFATGVD
jgi:hypothetical protein